jgi:hypothetical protein
VYKRLYWAGYRGKFASLRWPCNLLTPIPFPPTVTVFNLSELKAYKAASALTTYLNQLRTRLAGYKLHLLVHSQGNAIVSEAIKQSNIQFDTYILTQGALPASAYDNNAPTLQSLLQYETEPHLTPESQPFGYRNVYSGLAGKIVNFYNPQDAVLDIWINDQQVVKPSAGYHYDLTDIWYDGNIVGRQVTDSQEARAMVSRSRTLPIGQSGPPPGHGVIVSSVDLNAQFGFGHALGEHSAQWTRAIQTCRGYYVQILLSIR